MIRIVKYSVFLMLPLMVLAYANAATKGKNPLKQFADTVTPENGDKITFKMILVPAGVFTMGSPANEPDRQDHEGPPHKVKLDAFYMCPTEVTLELYLTFYQETMSSRKALHEMQEAETEKKQPKKGIDAITGPTPVYGELSMGYDKNHPAIGMTWYNANVFCRWLSLKTGRTYRLPTEAEWEYACRAGSKTPFYFGNDPKTLADYAWFDKNSDGETHPVAKKKPNAWGLYDMLGNVREWVGDFYSPSAYKEAAKKNPAVNPLGPKTGSVHVARGGDYTGTPEDLRCAGRSFEEDWWRSGDPQFPKSKWWLPQMDFIGFRVVKSVESRDFK